MGGQRDLELTMRRYALLDDQWDRIKDRLPRREGHVGVTAKDNRLFVEAVLYRYRAGLPWRDLPERFGDPDTVHTRFSRWGKERGLEEGFRNPGRRRDNEYAMIDSTIVRAHEHSAGARKKGRGSSHRALARRVEHQNPRHRRCTRHAGSISPVAKSMTWAAPMPCSQTSKPTRSSPTKRSMRTSACSSLSLKPARRR